MSKKVAIIGCGIFGASIALRLKLENIDVSVFEKKNAILQGASLNNQNRLHLGFHYPRDDETAQQCIAGFQKFIDAYPESITEPFPNAYFISECGSYTDPQTFLSFCDRNELSYEMVSEKNFPIVVNNVSLGLLCKERVYDSKKLSEIILKKMAQSRVEVRTSSKVDSIKYSNGSYVVVANDQKIGGFDSVINCSYADINRITAQLGYEVKPHQYEYTVVPVVKTKLPRVGITVMDGPFMTLLPYGSSENSLLYHVENTVIARETDYFLNPEWLSQIQNPFTKINRNNFFEKIMAKCSRYIPSVADSELVGFLHGPRMVLAKNESTDGRPSIVNTYEGNYHTVFSGKIDHCVRVADELTDRLLIK